MAKYIGKRIVPVHCGRWDMSKAYEMLSIVLDTASGDSYISRRDVPSGTALTDQSYWMLHSLFSQQIRDMSDQLTATEQRIRADNDVTEAAIVADNDATEAAVKADNTATKRYVDDSLAVLNSRVSSPFEIAATAAAMTDRTKAYVYTGSEEGYVSGGWYYHNGSRWVKGGTAVDPTLSVAGAPADAAETGVIRTDSLMPRGTIGVTIAETNLDNYLSPGIFRLTASMVATAENWPLSSRGMLVVLRTNLSSRDAISAAYIVQLAIGGRTMMYRLGAYVTAEDSVVWSDWFNMNPVPDTLLSEEGIPADAAAVGAALAEKLGAEGDLAEEDDLDTVTGIGMYSVLGDHLPQNYPFDVGGIALVVGRTDTESSGWKCQIILTAYDITWRYQKARTGWTAWQTLGNKEEIAGIAQLVGGTPVSLTPGLEWAQGGRHADTGGTFNSTTRIRSSQWAVPIGAASIHISDPSMKLYVFRFDAETQEYLGGSDWLTAGKRYDVQYGETLRFELAYLDDSEITPESELPDIWAEEKQTEIRDMLQDVAMLVGGEKIDISGELAFSQGAISSSTGAGTTLNYESRIHTNEYRTVPVGRLSIGHESLNHKLFVFRYSAVDGAYIGGSSWLSAGESFDVYAGEKVRFVLAYTDNAEITPDSEIPPIYITAEHGISEASSITGLPVLRLTGDISEMTKETKATLSYSIFGRTGTCTCKWQGSSSLRYPKKNFTIAGMDPEIDAWSLWARWVNSWRAQNGNISRMSTDSRWGTRKKYCLKANWVDPSAMRNIVCARLWGQVVASRDQVIGKLEEAPNYGAIDGFPVCLMINNSFAGLYTFNIPKDAYTFAMGGEGTEYVVGGESNSAQACRWKALSTGSGEDGDDYEIEYASDGIENSVVIESLNAAIAKVIAAHADWETECADYIDVESVIDYFIFVNCVGAHDNLARNILYGSYDGQKWFMSAYDLDTTFGVDPYGTTWFETVNDRNQFAEAAAIHRLCHLACKYSTAKFVARYKELRAGVLSDDHVWYELSRFAVDIPENGYRQDREKWPTMPGTSTSNMYQYMEFYRMHCAHLDKEVAAMEAELET